MPKKRTYLLHTEEILRELDTRAWELKQLAERSDVDAKTITNVVMNGKRASLKTLLGISRALKIDHDHLIHKSPARFLAPIRVTVYVDLPRKHFQSPKAMQQWKRSLVAKLRMVGQVEVENTTSRSVNIAFTFTEECDVHSLVGAFCGLALSDVGILRMEVPKSIDIAKNVDMATQERTGSSNLPPLIPAILPMPWGVHASMSKVKYRKTRSSHVLEICAGE